MRRATSRSLVLRWLLMSVVIGGGWFAFVPPTYADPLTDGWTPTTCGSSTCHGTPVRASGMVTTRNVNTAEALYFILNNSMLSAGANVTDITNDLQNIASGYCARPTASGGGSGSYMCVSRSANLVATTNAMSSYMLAARQTLFSTKTLPTFPRTRRGLDSAEQIFTIKNYRSTAINFTASSNSGEFILSVKPGCTTQLPAASVLVAGVSNPGMCTFGVTFRPSASTTNRIPHNGAINFAFSIPTSPGTFAATAPDAQSVALSGIADVPPVITMGSDKTTIVGMPVTLNGNTVTDANVTAGEVPESSLTYLWEVLSKPAGSINPTLSNQTSLNGATFTPDFIGTYSLRLSASDGVNPAATATLQVTATSVPVATISVAPTMLEFMMVQQNVSSASQPVTITNTGTATLNFVAPLPNDPMAVTGTGAADYIVTGCGPSLPAAPPAGPNACTLNIVFRPLLTGPRPATLTIRSNASNGNAVINLNGVGTDLPNPMVTGPAGDFADAVIGEPIGSTRTLTIFNARPNPVAYTIANLADFRVAADPCSGTVPGGSATCVITLEFRPTLGTGEGRRTGTFRVDLSGTMGDPNPNDADVSVAGNALLPLQLGTTLLNVDAVVGSPTVWTVLLTNRATTPLTLSSLAFSAAAASDYTIGAFGATPSCSQGLTLAPSGFCYLHVRFNPLTVGPSNATLTIGHTALGSPQTIEYLGTARPAPQGRIELSATNLAFADTQLASSSSLNVVLQNSGDSALAFNAFTFGGVHPGDFSRSGTCSTATPLPNGSTCTLTITFAPTVLGARNANLVITSDASNGPATITLGGTGVPIPAPRVSLTPGTLDFGLQTIGGLSGSRRVRLANSGTADLTVPSIVVAGTGFSNVSAAASACPAVLAAGAGCDIDIAFSAAAAIVYTGTLTVTSNAAGSPHVTVLQGTGTTSAPALVWTPAVTSLDFGPVSAGSLSTVQTVTLQNMGPGDATLNVLNATGPDAASFSMVGGTCSLGVPLLHGATCTVDIRFAPGSAGPKNAQVQVASTGSFPPMLALSGLGLAGTNPSFALSATSLAFESIRVGAQSLPLALRLTASGSGVVTVRAIDVTGPYAILSSTCPAMPFTLPAGAECAVSVDFRPTDEGNAAGMLRVTIDAAPASREVALSGNGEGETDVTSGGGCSISTGKSPLDPTLWLLLLVAIAVAWRREASRRRAPRRGRTGNRYPEGGR